jgi:hypothetical protein
VGFGICNSKEGQAAKKKGTWRLDRFNAEWGVKDVKSITENSGRTNRLGIPLLLVLM